MKVMTVPQLREWQDRRERFLLVNVMNEDEFQSGYIPGSINVPSGDHQFGERIAELADGRVWPVVVYSSNHESPSSQQAATRLELEGFSQVYNLGAGLEGWAAEGLPVETSPAAQAVHG